MFARLLLAASLARAHVPEGGISCPGSPATVHAWLTVNGTAQTTCRYLRQEILARVDGQGSAWADPHGGGTYRGVLASSNADVDLEVDLELERESANGQYTDRMLFTFMAMPLDGGCVFTGCSESQGESMSDQSTNYCNLWNLFCGAAEECCAAQHSFVTAHLIVSSHQAAGRNVNVCLGGSGGSGGGADQGQRQTACLNDTDASAGAAESADDSEGDSEDEDGGGAEGGSGEHAHEDEAEGAEDREDDDHEDHDDHDHDAAADDQVYDHAYGYGNDRDHWDSPGGGGGGADAGASEDGGHTHGPNGTHAAHHAKVGEVSRAAHAAWRLPLLLLPGVGVWRS